ncbi:MAG TPA: threonine--tRNA ligase [Thermoguttaceae bacterium]|nr:threonine--tRNA ligase [Thermoguttaceae bacterium]
MLKVKLPDGSFLDYSCRVRPIDVAGDIGPGLAKATLAATVDGRLVGADSLLPEDGEVSLRLITKKDPEALNVMRHSAAHVMARAVMRLFEGVQLAFGPTVENGFYYDFDLKHALSGEDFPAIEAEMAKIIAEDEPFERVELDRREAIQLCEDLGQTLKVEHLEDGLGQEASVSFYRQGEFVDLCRGPHVPSPKAIGAVKLLSVAGAYWKGDASNRQLQRLYGTAWFSKADLEAHLEQVEEAKRRDHRLLGRKLRLFEIDEQVGQGLVLWKPRGAIIRGELQQFIGEHLRRQKYQTVFTPHIGKLDLFRTSGHFPYYRDSQYPPMVLHEQMKLLADENCSCGDLANRLEEGNIDGYLLKPMNCPFHIKIYQSEPRSYRDLPIRFAEFGTVYRWEQSGELGGMTRVRGFTQDDAHLFVTEEQLDAEVAGCLELVKIIFGTLGMTDYRVRVGMRGEDSDKYVGSPQQWQQAEAACRRAAELLEVPFSAEEGEAAFYGPKIDFIVKDVIGREWQLGTVQVDYQLPERFELTYTGADNRPHRPVMIHRAPFGSMERFVGVLIEHFAGAFPLWLAPEQVRVMVVSQKFEPYGRQVEQRLADAGLRVSGDYRAEKIGAKIRDAQLELVPYMFVIGGREMENQTVAVRDRLQGDLGAVPLDEALGRLVAEIEAKTVRQAIEGRKWKKAGE